MRSLLMVLSALVLVTPLAAQRDSLLGRKIWVRNEVYHRMDKGIKGVVEEVKGDTLSVRSAESGELVTVWPTRERRLFVYAGRKPSVARGAAIGAIGGGLLGLLVGVAFSEYCPWPPCKETSSGEILAGVGLSAGYGLVLGGLGGLTRTHEAWKRDMGFTPMKVTIRRLRGGRLGVGLTARR